MQEYAQDLSIAFGGHEALHLSENGTGQVKALACMNAFTPEIIDRIVQTAKELKVDSREVLCLTGAARESGIEAAREHGMSILAVGHKRCEMWGLRYLEKEARKTFPHCEIILHEEDEEPICKSRKATRPNGGPAAGSKMPDPTS
jgi:putative NIF3 family GTP cyclohydrolase 1 type 2